MYIMFDIIDTLFSYRKGLIVCSLHQEFSNTKESTLHVSWNVDTAFLLCGTTLFLVTVCYWNYFLLAFSWNPSEEFSRRLMLFNTSSSIQIQCATSYLGVCTFQPWYLGHFLLHFFYCVFLISTQMQEFSVITIPVLIFA